MSQSSTEATDGTNGRLLIYLAMVVFVVSVVALVILESMGRSTTNLMALVGPVVAGLLVGGHVSNLTSQQNRSIQKIEAQTNGVLDARIHDQGKAATLEALREVGLLQVTPEVTPEVAPMVAPPDASESTLPPGFVDVAMGDRKSPAAWHPLD